MNKYFKTLLAAAVIVGFTSCLKDKEFEDNKYGLTNVEGGKYIELGFADDQAHTQSIGLEFEDQSVNPKIVTVRLASKEAATEDIVVTLDTTGMDAYITKYNLDNETSVEALPNAFFTWPASGFKVTIPKGSREVTLAITTNAIQFNPSTTYGLYLKIASVDKPGYLISGNFGEFFSTLGAKNKYDGIYSGKGYSNLGTGNTAPPYLFNFPCSWEVSAYTTSGVKIDMDAQPIIYADGSMDIGFGVIVPAFTFDPNTDKIIAVTPSSLAAAGALSLQFPVDGGTYDSRYDPATKTIYVKYGVNNNPAWRFIDTLKYCGPRP